MKSSHRSLSAWELSSLRTVAHLCRGAAGLACTGAASAAIVYSGAKNIAITQDFEGVFINVTNFQSGQSANSSWDLNPFFGGLGIANSPDFQPVRIGTGNEDSILSLSFGTSIGGSSTFSSGWGGSGAEDESGHVGPGASQFAAGQICYMGFKLIRDDSINYGWMRVILTQNGDTGSIVDWAYETSGDSILSGSLTDLGAAPLVRVAGTSETLSASEAGTGILMEPGAQVTFSEGSEEGLYSGQIDGAGEIRISGTGGLRLSGQNTFSGSASVLEGSRLTVGNSGNLGGAEVKIGSSAILVFDSLLANDGSLNTFANTISSDGQVARLDNSGSGKVVLSGEIFSNGGSLEFTGGSFDVRGDISGSGSLLKEGAGTLTLAGSNTYSGDTTVRSGALIVNGVLAATSDVFVESGGKLKGIGSIGGSVEVSGALAAGNSPGILTVSGGTNFSSGSVLEWELDTAQSNPETNRGTAYDGLNTSSVSGSGAFFRIMLTGTQDFSDSFWDQSRTWTDIFKSADGSTNLSDWASIFSGGFQYSYNGKTVEPTSSGSFALSGSTLTWSAVPESSNIVAGLLAASALLRRRRVV